MFIQEGQMKRRILLGMAALAVVISTLACEVSTPGAGGSAGTVVGSGAVVEETRTVNGISGVELAMPGTLHVETGSSEALRIEAEDNLLAYITTEVRAGTLVINTQSGTNLRSTRPMNYYLTVTELDRVADSSSGDIQASDLKAGRFSISISSSGNLSMGNLQCSSLEVEISSSGDVNLGGLTADTLSVRINSSGNLDIAGGQVQRQDIAISSSGEYHSKNLASAEAQVQLNSSGSATIRVSDRLRGTLSSSGNVYYIGSPEVDMTQTSSGRAVRING
jgi:hypothetical protein